MTNELDPVFLEPDTPLEIVEIRCPVGPQRLFAKLRLDGIEKPHITDDNLAEFACSDCRKSMRENGKKVSLVLHRYNFLGELVETAVQR